MRRLVSRPLRGLLGGVQSGGFHLPTAGRMRLAWSVMTVTLTLTVAGILSDRWISPVWEGIRADEPGFDLDDLTDALGHGVTIGILGGFRAITADFLWLANNLAWERRDLPASQTLIKLVSAVDPRPLFFWINGARMIAYDMPVWRVEQAGGYPSVSEAIRRRLDAEQAEVALRFLERALRFHPEDPFLFIEMANIHLRRLDDLETAAVYYRLAAQRPGAPYYAARIHAELLKQLGRREEALEWLRTVHRTLPADEPMALAEVVLARIRELEDALGIPEVRRYESGSRDGNRQ